MSRVLLHSLVFLFILCGCTGSVPTQGKLPSVDGSNVTNVTATSVGATSAADIAATKTTVDASTSNATAATIVKRDASGNFSAGTITANLTGSASWAQGRVGATIPSASNITIPQDGNLHPVTGTQTINSIATLPGGTQALLVFSSNLILHNNSQLLLMGGGDYKTSGRDLFMFHSGGDGTWAEDFRYTTKDSHVRVHRAAALSIPSNGSADVHLFDTVDEDTQSEYDLATNTFTAKQQGVYQINFAFVMDNGWNGGFCKGQIVADGFKYTTDMYPNPAATCANSISVAVTLAPGKTVQGYAGNGDPNAHNVLGQDTTTYYSWMSITRLH